jgi:hypothetical protein
MLTFWTKYAYWLSIAVFAGAIVAGQWYLSFLAVGLLLLVRWGYDKGGQL